MKIANEYSAINSTHDDIKGTQQQQQDGINAAVFNGEKLLHRAWMVMVTMGMLFLLLKPSGQTKFFATDGVVSDALRSLEKGNIFAGCIHTREIHKASCPEYYYLREVAEDNSYFVSECCPVNTDIPQVLVRYETRLFIFNGKLDRNRRMFVGGVSVPITATIKDLKAAIKSDTRLTEEHLILTNKYNVVMTEEDKSIDYYHLNEEDNMIKIG